jgi:bacteriocin biosynthesis cyclodehydratase domain-containing protein
VQLQIKSGLRRVWREAGTLQIGLSHRRGTVIAGLTAADVPLIEQLRDGVDASVIEAEDDGLDAARRRELVSLLTEAGVLVGTGVGTPLREGLGSAAERLVPDAAIWSLVHPDVGDGWSLLAARASRRVFISGAGRLGSTVATTLAAAGVGELLVGDQRRVTAGDLAPGGAGRPDVGRLREEATLDAVRRFGSRAERGGSLAERTSKQSSPKRPDLVILIEHGAADATAAGRLVSADLPHLSVVIREDDILVGPLVRPGSGPCLRCLDLHRGDRDPAWPSVLAQLLSPASGTLQPEETAASTLAAGLVALQALAHLDGVTDPATAGATLEIELPDGLIARRSWPPHPGCGCHWPPQPTGSPPEPATAGDDPVTTRTSRGSSADRRAARSPADARFSRPTRTMEP